MLSCMGSMGNRKRIEIMLNEIERLPLDEEPSYKLVSLIAEMLRKELGEEKPLEQKLRNAEGPLVINLDELKEKLIINGGDETEFNNSIALLNAMSVFMDGKTEGLSLLNGEAFYRIYIAYCIDAPTYTQDETAPTLSRGARK